MLDRIDIIKSVVAAGTGGAVGGGAVATLLELDWISIAIVATLAGLAGVVAAANRAAKAQRAYPVAAVAVAFGLGVVSGAVVFLVVSSFHWDMRLQLAMSIMAGVLADYVMERGPFAFVRRMGGGE